MSIQSRAFQHEFESDEVKTETMVPYGDLINHTNKPHLEWDWKDDGEEKGFVMHAMSDIARGQ